MSVRSIEGLQRYLRRLCDEAVPPEDTVLLDRFVTARDREPFALLIARHGPMVLGTARRFVENIHDAADVFQAVFLSLARLAKSIRQGRALPAWLHQATCRIAAKVRKDRDSGSQERSPEPCETIDPAARLAWLEVRQALDEELRRLSERLRSPLLLCYLSGLTRDEAARQLGWSLGTLKRRLEEGRKALHIRLARRGITSVGLALAVLTPEALQAGVSTALLDATLRLISSTPAAVPATIAALVLGSAANTKGHAMKSLVAFVAAVALGVGTYSGMSQADPPMQTEGRKAEVKAAQEEQDVQRDDPLPAGSTLRFGTSRFRHGVKIAAMAVSADGKTAVVSTPTLPFSLPDGSTRAYDLVSGRALPAPSNNEAGAIAFSPDGQTVVIKQDLLPTVQDFKTGKVLRSIKFDVKMNPRSTEVHALAFTPDGKAVATASDGNDVFLIDIESGKTIHTFAHENPESGLSGGFSHVLAVAFSPDGKWLASGGYENDKGDYFAPLWDVETGKEVRRFMLGRKGSGARCVAFSPDGKTLATLGSHGGTILRFFDVETGKERRAFLKEGDHRTKAGSLAFAPDGKTVAAAGDALHVVDVTTGEERLRIDRRAIGPHFTDAGKTLVAAVDGTIYRWDTATGKTLTPEGGDSGVEQILVTADGNRVVTRDRDGYSADGWLYDGYLFDLSSGKATNVTGVERVSHYNVGLGYLPSDATKLGFLALVDGVNRRFRMDLDGKNKRDVFKDSPNLVHGMSLSPDGKRGAYEDERYRLFLADGDGSNAQEVETGQRFNFLPSWSPDGSWVLFLACEHYDCHPHVVKPDGTGLKKLASRNGYRGVIDYFDVYDFHDGSSVTPVWAPDGKSIFYTAKVGRNVELFRVPLDGKPEQLTDRPAGAMHYHPSPSPDGKWLVYGSKRDGVRQLYVKRLSDKKEWSITDLVRGRAAMWPSWQRRAR